MGEKSIVHFEALPVLPYESDYLSYCMHCGTYNLGHKPCVKCGMVEEVSIDKIAAKTVRKYLGMRLLIAVLIYILLFIVSMSFAQIFLATLFTAACLGGNLLIYFKFKEVLIREEMSKHIEANCDKIKLDLGRQLGIATQNVEEGNLVEAYDRFRYLAKLMDTEEIRTYKLICLRSFHLRSDMPLEMNSLLLEEYNSHLIAYIYEVSKVKKELIDDATIAYIMKYKDQILMKNKGRKVIGSVLVACLRSKFLFLKYAEELPGYLEYFSKERLLRLCKLSKALENSMLRKRLLSEVREIVGEDEAFISYYEELEN